MRESVHAVSEVRKIPGPTLKSEVFQKRLSGSSNNSSDDNDNNNRAHHTLRQSTSRNLATAFDKVEHNGAEKRQAEWNETPIIQMQVK